MWHTHISLATCQTCFAVKQWASETYCVSTRFCKLHPPANQIDMYLICTSARQVTGSTPSRQSYLNQSMKSHLLNLNPDSAANQLIKFTLTSNKQRKDYAYLACRLGEGSGLRFLPEPRVPPRVQSEFDEMGWWRNADKLSMNWGKIVVYLLTHWLGWLTECAPVMSN